ncbi:MAG: hypothetical protein AB7S26_39095 [Sandaracinaceae bacterium]
MTHRRRWLSPRWLALALLGIAACGPATYEFHGTERAVGVDGKLEVSSIDGDNREVRLELRYLPPPDRIQAGTTVYAMWIVPTGQTPMLGGILQYDEGDRKGRARATTPAQRFEIRVTAETDRQVAAPSEFVVARYRVE